MDKGLNWRPAIRELAEAEQLLLENDPKRFETRLEIVRALQAARSHKLSVIAQKASTRSSVVREFLSRWRTHGVRSVVAFGHPRDLNESQLKHLSKELEAGRLRSIDVVRNYIAEKFGVSFGIRSVRSYCEELGFDLPLSVRTTKLHSSWSKADVEKAAGEDKTLKNRVTAILRACAEPSVPLREIARLDCSNAVPESTLRADLKALRPETTMDDFLRSRLRLPILDRFHLRQAFYDWAMNEYKSTGSPPSAREGLVFLKGKGIQEIAEKTVYSYLEDWKRHAKIESRQYNSRERISPSEGLAVRSTL